MSFVLLYKYTVNNTFKNIFLTIELTEITIPKPKPTLYYFNTMKYLNGCKRACSIIRWWQFWQIILVHYHAKYFSLIVLSVCILYLVLFISLFILSFDDIVTFLFDNIINI